MGYATNTSLVTNEPSVDNHRNLAREARPTDVAPQRIVLVMPSFTRSTANHYGTTQTTLSNTLHWI